MKKIVVTGGSGKAGRATIRELVEHGYTVTNVDIVRPGTPPPYRAQQDLEQASWLDVPFMQADLTDLGQAYEVLKGADAVVHLAAIPAPGLHTSGVTFQTNMMSSYNIFQAAVDLGLQRIVWASSETTLGLPFDREKPAYAPIDEAHPLYPESSYALSKVLTEQMAQQFNRWSGIPIVGLRFSNVMEPHQYARFTSFWDDPMIRKWNLWGYVDARDTAQCCRLGLEADITGSEDFIVAAADTCMTRTNAELMAEVFPGVPLKAGTGDHDTLLSVDKARRMLGYAPQFSWRDHVRDSI